MMYTGMRVGNIESTLGLRSKKGVCTFGVTTLQKRHFTSDDKGITIEFVGKKGVFQSIRIENPKLVAQVTNQLRQGGEEFLNVTDANVRAFVKRLLGDTFVVKDFRTMYANAVATSEVLKGSKIGATCKVVASKLGNTPAISRKAYIDPKIFELKNNAI